MITLYGSARSSAGRCLWMLEEIGTPYTLKEVDMRNKEHKSPEFLKINPNGKVPALVDGDIKLFESFAINLYLAEKYKNELLGKTPAEKGEVYQWSFWAATELQPLIIGVLIEKMFKPDGQRDNALIEENTKEIPRYLDVLNNSLAGKRYVAGTQFTVADINMASVVGICPMLGIDLGKYTSITQWMKGVSDRPSFQKYMSMRS